MDAITAYSESRNNPDAVSPKGARGVMQVMPSTARDPGFGIRPSNGTPEDDARLGREYRAAMEQRYGGDLAKMWAAFNMGPGALDAVVKAHPSDWWLHVPRETQRYVEQNLGMAMGG